MLAVPAILAVLRWSKVPVHEVLGGSPKVHMEPSLCLDGGEHPGEVSVSLPPTLVRLLVIEIATHKPARDFPQGDRQPEIGALYLTELTILHANMGDTQSAEYTLDGVRYLAKTVPKEADSILCDASRSLFLAGHRKLASSLADAIEDADYQFFVYRDTFEHYLEEGGGAAASQVFEEAIDVLDKHPPSESDYRYGQIVFMAAQATLLGRVEFPLERLEEVVRRTQDPLQSARSEHAVSLCFQKQGLEQKAREHLRIAAQNAVQSTDSDRLEWVWMLGTIAIAQANAHDEEGARQTVAQMLPSVRNIADVKVDGYERLSPKYFSFAAAALVMKKTGESAEAMRLFEEARIAMHSEPVSDDRASWLGLIATFLAGDVSRSTSHDEWLQGPGDMAMAYEWCQTLENPIDRTCAYLGVIGAVANYADENGRFGDLPRYRDE